MRRNRSKKGKKKEKNKKKGETGMGTIWTEYDRIDELGERYDLAEKRTRELAASGEIAGSVPAPYAAYFTRVAQFISMICEVKEKRLGGFYGKNQAGEDLLSRLQKTNRDLYADLLPDHYGESYANPEYAVRQLGEDFGPLLCFLYAQERGLIAYLYEDRLEEMVVHMELFLQVYGLFASGDLPRPASVKDALYWFESDNADIFVRNRIRAQIDPACDDATVALMSLDPKDPVSLYQTGEYITKNELRTFTYLASLSQEEIRKMADTFTEGYRQGFLMAGKPLYKKRTVSLIYHVGFERMLQEAVRSFQHMGLRVTISRYGVSAVTGTSRLSGYTGASPNPQYDYDHREDAALFLDKAFVERKVAVTEAVYREFLDQAHRYAGPAILEVFGDTPFEPKTKKEAWKYTADQQELAVRMKNETSRLTQEAIYGQERSFTIISFPLPSIDQDRYEEIFRQTMEVNTLDSEHYRKIQQTIIDALDRGSSVHIVGKGANHTDLTVQLCRLDHPDRETLFENCTADVNIPVGEVFTTPALKGTEGVLHVSQVYLQGLNFTDLELRFADGCVTDYSCGTFDKPEEGRRYIEENILFHHKTLPMGEFAIGTNTTAYAMIRKYGIGSKMDILIAEKTGPHFAVGDTCYSWEEDNVTYNPDGKKLVAKENDFSLLREEKPEEAYFNCHTDITIPYEELGLIEAIDEETGYRKEIIRDGHFVLEGTEELNEPLKELETQA